MWMVFLLLVLAVSMAERLAGTIGVLIVGALAFVLYWWAGERGYLRKLQRDTKQHSSAETNSTTDSVTIDEDGPA